MKLTKVGKIVLVLTILFISLLVFLWWNDRKDNSVHKMESNDFFDIKIDYDKTGVDEIDKKVSELKDLSIRSWECLKCGTLHNRGINASINIMFEGLKMYANSL